LLGFSLAANKMSCGMPEAYSTFRKICHVVADSETWPNATTVARFEKRCSRKLAAVHPLRKQFTAKVTLQALRRIASG
jgi:hypothetical protein